jgi:hypothetical protein
MLPELPDDDPDDPDPPHEDEPSRSGVVVLGLVTEPLLLLLPGSWPGNCAVWQAGRGSLGRQSAGVWPDRLLLPEVEPDDDEPGLVVLLLP